ncbi:MAG: DNA polymerase III subunit gamma/tau [Balneolaceae bacterium]
MSENYRALTRKYRPQNFEDIVSQEHVSNTLMNAIKQNRLSHAYMFCGPRGVGKTTMARVLARIINQVDSSVDGEALNQTLNIIEMDAASNNKVEDVHLLRESVRIPPQNGRYKIFIVDEVHMLTKQAFNALLKTLEEPPEHAIFIFATTEPHKVLPTILSRVQRFDFKRISVEEVVHRLRKISLDENITIDDESLHVIAKKADGALRDALGLMDQAIAFCGDTITYKELLLALNVVGTDRLFEFMNCVKDHDADKGLDLINTLLQEGYDIQEFLLGLTEHLRNLYIAHHSQKLYLVEGSEETKALYKKTAPDFSRDDLMRMLHIVSEAQIKLKDANQPRIQFEITLLKLIHMERSENLNELLAALSDLKKNSSNLEKQASAAPEQPSATESTRQQPQQVTESAENVAPPQVSEADVTPSVQIPESKPEMAEVEEHDEFGLGRPTLVTKHTTIQKNIRTVTERRIEVVSEEVSANTPPKVLRIDDVKAAWPDYLMMVKNEFQMVLHLQVERVQPKDLKGTQLVLECDNPLAIQMLEAQSLELAKKLKECIGTLLRFKFELIQSDTNATKARNPYDRFKEIQEKDPIIKELVERFGAELQY